MFDDTTWDKLYAKKIEFVSYVWSGKHHQVIKEMDVSSLIWTGEIFGTPKPVVFQIIIENTNEHFIC